MQEIDDAKADLMETMKSFIKDGSPKKDRPSDDEPVILKNKRPSNGEAMHRKNENSEQNGSEIFYDAVEDDGFCTPARNSISILSSFSFKTNKHEVSSTATA